MKQIIFDELNNCGSKSEMTETENGASAYSSTGSWLLDMFTLAVRGKEEERMVSLFQKSLQENSQYALALLMHLRDARNGKGERDLTYYCMLYLRHYYYHIYLKNLENMLEMGYYKDLMQIVKLCAISNIVSGFSSELLKIFMDETEFSPMTMMNKAIGPYLELVNL